VSAGGACGESSEQKLVTEMNVAADLNADASDVSQLCETILL